MVCPRRLFFSTPLHCCVVLWFPILGCVCLWWSDFYCPCLGERGGGAPTCPLPPSADATNLMVEYETRKKELWQEGVAPGALPPTPLPPPGPKRRVDPTPPPPISDPPGAGIRTLHGRGATKCGARAHHHRGDPPPPSGPQPHPSPTVSGWMLLQVALSFVLWHRGAGRWGPACRRIRSPWLKVEAKSGIGKIPYLSLVG